jgi:hypothetical protein
MPLHCSRRAGSSTADARPHPRPHPVPRPLSQVWGSQTPLTLRVFLCRARSWLHSLDRLITGSLDCQRRGRIFLLTDLPLSFTPPPSLPLPRSSDGFFARTRPLSPGLTTTQTKSTPRCLRTKGQGQGQGQAGDHPCKHLSTCDNPLERAQERFLTLPPSLLRNLRHILDPRSAPAARQVQRDRGTARQVPPLTKTACRHCREP